MVLSENPRLVSNLLRPEVIQWLLEDSNPSIQYLTLTKLLGVSPRRKEALRARDRIAAWVPVSKILAKQRRNGGWDHGPSWYHPKYRATIWQLIILSQTGIDPESACVQKMCEYAIRFQGPSGEFRSEVMTKGKEDWGCRAGCLNGNVVAAMCRLGWARDKRTQRAVEHLVSFQEPDGGWGCRTFGYHKRDKHSCFMGTICALDGLIEYSEFFWSKSISRAVKSACEFLLMHRLYKADHHGWNIMKRDFTKLRGPWLVSYDILRGLRALTRTGIVGDERLNDAVGLLMAKRKSNGRWLREVNWPSETYSTFGRAGCEDKWVTFNALLVLNELSLEEWLH